jgi:hypothetical protein
MHCDDIAQYSSKSAPELAGQHRKLANGGLWVGGRSSRCKRNVRHPAVIQSGRPGRKPDSPDHSRNVRSYGVVEPCEAADDET